MLTIQALGLDGGDEQRVTVHADVTKEFQVVELIDEIPGPAIQYSLFA